MLNIITRLKYRQTMIFKYQDGGEYPYDYHYDRERA